MKNLLLALVSAVSLAGIALPAHARGGLSDGGGQTLKPAACAGLAGATFESQNLYEGGLTPTGPALMHYRVRFGATGFNYALSDFSLDGHFKCSEPEGQVTADRADFPLDGFYNAGTGLLLWHGKWFTRISGR